MSEQVCMPFLFRGKCVNQECGKCDRKHLTKEQISAEEFARLTALQEKFNKRKQSKQRSQRGQPGSEDQELLRQPKQTRVVVQRVLRASPQQRPAEQQQQQPVDDPMPDLSSTSPVRPVGAEHFQISTPDATLAYLPTESFDRALQRVVEAWRKVTTWGDVARSFSLIRRRELLERCFQAWTEIETGTKKARAIEDRRQHQLELFHFALNERDDDLTSVLGCTNALQNLKSLGHTYITIGAAVGLRPAEVSEWLNGRSRMTAKRLAKLSNIITTRLPAFALASKEDAIAPGSVNSAVPSGESAASRQSPLYGPRSAASQPAADHVTGGSAAREPRRLVHADD